MQLLLENIPVIVRDQHGLAFIAVFIGGLISAASPCVPAAIPLIIGYVGVYSEGNKKKQRFVRWHSSSASPLPSQYWAPPHRR